MNEWLNAHTYYTYRIYIFISSYLPTLNKCRLNQHLEMISGKGNKDENVATDLTNACINAMQDKIASVRSLSEQLLTGLMARGIINRSMLDKATRDLPTATKRSLQSSLDRMNAAFGTKKSGADVPATTPAAVPVTSTGISVASTSSVETSVKAAKGADPLTPKRPGMAPTSTAVINAAFDGYAFKKTNKVKRSEEFNKVGTRYCNTFCVYIL